MINNHYLHIKKKIKSKYSIKKIIKKFQNLIKILTNSFNKNNITF